MQSTGAPASAAWAGPSLLLVLTLCGSACTLVEQLKSAAIHLSSGDTVTITAVKGGDDIVVTKDAADFLVHLQGVQAFDPVVGDAYVQTESRLATSFLEPWRGRRVRLYFEAADLDPAGRYLAYVQQDNTELNLQMVREGIAPVYTEYPFGHEIAYLEAEKLARAEARGIWAEPKTIFVVSGLRRVWRQARQNRHAPLVPDPLRP